MKTEGIYTSTIPPCQRGARGKGTYLGKQFAQNSLIVIPYMVSPHFARLSSIDDRDRIASVYPAC